MAATSVMAADGTAGKAKLAGTTWQSIAQLPDWSGVWELDWRAGAGRGAAGMPKLTPEAQAKLDKYRADQKEGKNAQTNTANCDPPGMPQIMTQPYPVEFLVTPGKVTVAIEAYSQMRRIFVDGRPLPKDPQPTWLGYSVGRWEGDTLVVETNGFRNGTWLDAVGNPLTEAAKITERFHRLNFGQLEIELTVDDPKAYTKPWTIKLNQTIRLDTDLLDYVVNENEKDLQHIAPTIDKAK